MVCVRVGSAVGPHGLQARTWPLRSCGHPVLPPSCGAGPSFCASDTAASHTTGLCLTIAAGSELQNHNLCLSPPCQPTGSKSTSSRARSTADAQKGRRIAWAWSSAVPRNVTQRPCCCGLAPCRKNQGCLTLFTHVICQIWMP